MPPLIHNFFSIPEILRKTQKILHKVFRFGPVRQKFPTKPWCPPPLLCMKIFDKRIFLKHQSVLQWNISYSETKNFRRKILILPPLLSKLFRYPKLVKHWRVPLRSFSALWDQKFSTEKRDTPLFIHNFFETKNFLKNCRISLRKFSALWDIKISTENRDMPPLIHKFFSIPEILRKTQKILHKVFRFGPVRQKFPTKPWCPPPPMHENFR